MIFSFVCFKKAKMLNFLDIDGFETAHDEDKEVERIFEVALPRSLTDSSPSEEEVDCSVLQILRFDSLMCPICMDIIAKPRILSCHHVFCRACLLGVVHASNDQTRVVCCVCRQSTSVVDVKIFDVLASLMKEMYGLARQLEDARHLVW